MLAIAEYENGEDKMKLTLLLNSSKRSGVAFTFCECSEDLAFLHTRTGSILKVPDLQTKKEKCRIEFGLDFKSSFRNSSGGYSDRLLPLAGRGACASLLETAQRTQ